jgi:hypothetical protein
MVVIMVMPNFVTAYLISVEWGKKWPGQQTFSVLGISFALVQYRN